MNSRTLQNLQHLFGGAYSILLMLTATFAGMAISKTLDVSIPITIGAITFIMNRVSNEITYQTTKALLKERNV